MAALNDIGLMLIRGMVGYVMFFHGAQKLFTEKYLGLFGGGGIKGFAEKLPEMVPLPAQITPTTAAYAAAIAEFGGGLMLMLGFGTRVAAVFVAFTMGVAAFTVHAGKFSLQQGGMEYPVTLMFIAIGLLFAGPGRLSLDNLFTGRPRKPRVVKEK